MGVLTAAPGVVKKAARIFVTHEDVAELLGCGKSKAYEIVRGVNELAKKKGNQPFPAGKANKYLFSDIFDIPIEEIDKVISNEMEVKHGVF